MELETKIDRLHEVLHRYAESLDQFIVLTERTVRVRGAKTKLS